MLLSQDKSILVNPRLCRGPRIGYGFDISRMLGLWAGGKELLGKKHRPGLPISWGLRPASSGCGGLNGRPAGRPYNGITLSSEKEWLARPVHEIKTAS